MFVPSKILKGDIAAALKAVASGPLDGAKLHLFSNNINPTPTNVVGDFTIAVFTGYTDPLTVVWGTPFVSDDGEWWEFTGTYTIICTAAPVAPLQVFGVYMTDTTNAIYLGADLFTTPQNIVNVGDAVVFNLRIRVPGTAGNWGSLLEMEG